MATRKGWLLRLLMIALLLSIKGQTVAGTSVNTEIEQLILTIDREKDEAMQKFAASHGKVGGDVLDRIYADGLVFVNTHGQLLTKTQRLEDLRAGNLKFLSFGRDDYRLHVYGNTVIMTGRATSVVEYQGKVNRTPRQFTNVYVKLDGHWRLVAHQATTIVEP
jgi:hypothetical protein